jgi:hypothetical protein
MSTTLQKVHHLLDVALLIIDGLVLLKYKRYAATCLAVLHDTSYAQE